MLLAQKTRGTFAGASQLDMTHSPPPRSSPAIASADDHDAAAAYLVSDVFSLFRRGVASRGRFGEQVAVLVPICDVVAAVLAEGDDRIDAGADQRHDGVLRWEGRRWWKTRRCYIRA